MTEPFSLAPLHEDTCSRLTSVCASPRADTNNKVETQKYAFEYEAEPFSFAVLRAGPAAEPADAPLWNTTGLRLLYKDQYLELSSWVPPTSTIYGLGERISSSGAFTTSSMFHISTVCAALHRSVPVLSSTDGVQVMGFPAHVMSVNTYTSDSPYTRASLSSHPFLSVLVP